MKQLLLLLSLMLTVSTSSLLAQDPCDSDQPIFYTGKLVPFFSQNQNSPIELTVGQTVEVCVDKNSNTNRTIEIRNVEQLGEGPVATIDAYTPFGTFEDVLVEDNTNLPAVPVPPGEYGVRFTANSEGTFDISTTRTKVNTNPNRPGFSLQTRTISFVVASVNLPVSWTKNLTYEPFGENVRFNWSVAEQVDVEGYELERMYEGGSFEKVADIAYQENGSLEVDYSTVVNWPTQSAYYRVKQLDYAGTFDYSNTVFVKGNDSAVQQFKMFPNPATNFVRMSVPENIRSVDLISASGRLVRSYTAAEVNREGMDVSQVSAGVYLVRPVSAEGPTKTQRLVVNH